MLYISYTFANQKDMKPNNTYNVLDLTDGTATNAQGFAVFTIAQQHINDGQKAVFSFHNTSGLSTSFLNSFVAELLDQYGLDKVKQYVGFTGLTKVQANHLKTYISNYKSHFLK